MKQMQNVFVNNNERLSKQLSDKTPTGCNRTRQSLPGRAVRTFRWRNGVDGLPTDLGSGKGAMSKFDFIKVGGFVIAVLGFLLGGGFYYNEIWKSKVLTYTVLPKYDLGDQVFSGIVIENRGRVPLTSLEIIFSNLDSEIDTLNIPGPHESLEVASGGEGENELFIRMPRLSSGVSLAIYMLTSENIYLEEGKTFQITSRETVGAPVGQQSSGVPVSIFLISFILWIFSLVIAVTVIVANRLSSHPEKPRRTGGKTSRTDRAKAKASSKFEALERS